MSRQWGPKPLAVRVDAYGNPRAARRLDVGLPLGESEVEFVPVSRKRDDRHWLIYTADRDGEERVYVTQDATHASGRKGARGYRVEGPFVPEPPTEDEKGIDAR